MEEEDEARRMTEEARATTLASLRPDLTVSLTSNGHSVAASAGERGDASEKKVDPLKIRLGGKVPRSYTSDVKKRGFISIGRCEDIQTETRLPKQRIVERKSFGSLPLKTANQTLSPALGRLQVETMNRNFLSLKKGKPEKGSQLKEYAQSLGLQPTVKFKCRKCSSMSFKSLVTLKEHQRQCKAQVSSGGGEADRTVTGGGSAPGRVTRKVYLCSACSTYYENWNLFLHMREVHNRHICLFCLGMFSKAEKLASHLVSKHCVVEQTFKDKEEFQTEYNGSVYLMCSFCDKLYTEKDNFSMHKCTVPVPVLVSRKVSKDITVNAPSENFCVENDINGAKTDVNKPYTSNSNKVELPQPAVPFCVTAQNERRENLSPEPCSHASPDKSQNAENSISQNTEISDNLTSDSINVSNESEAEKLAECNSAVEATPIIQKEVTPSQDDGVPSAPDVRSNSRNRERESISSYDTEDDSSTMDIDPAKNENNNVTNNNERDGGIKLKLSLNNALSPVIINSTVRPDDTPKPQVRPNRPPGGRPVLSSDPLPPPAPINNVHSTIYDNQSESLNTINKVPKLTVRVPKGLLDKDSSSDESSDSDMSDKLTVDDTPRDETCEAVVPAVAETTSQIDPASELAESLVATVSKDDNSQTEVVPAEDDIALTELTLDRPLDKYPMKELLKVFVGGTMYYCVYCNHARKIAVNCKQLALHMLEEHRFSATVDSITAEELLPETIRQRVRTGLDEVQSIYVNLDTYDSVDPCQLLPYVRTYECFQCYFITTVHKDLYLHNRKMHQRTSLLCVMCKSSFYNYSELLCHLCAGTFDSEYEIGFRCCMCNMDNIPSAFRLMVHLRKVHHACDVCTEICHNQSRLSMHVWKHKLHHMCYRCGIAYRNKADITKHLFWKHGTESALCKKCLQKKWPHMYHFCIPPTNFVCEECNENFTRAVSLKVHKRFHSGNYPHPCLVNECSEKFVSKKLLAKHMIKHQQPKCEELDTKVEPLDVENIEKEESKEAITQELAVKVEVKVDEKSEPINPGTESPTKLKVKKKKNKDKDSFLLDVNLPALNLSESDSSDDSDAVQPLQKTEEESTVPNVEDKNDDDKIQPSDLITEVQQTEETESKENIIDIWDNFKQYQAKIEKQKSPPLVLIRKHVCESDHDYCIIPNDVNGEGNEVPGKRQKKRSPRKRSNKNSTGSSSSSSSSSSSDSCCSRGSKCSCSTSTGTSSSSSSDSDSSRDSLSEKKKKIPKHRTSKRLDSNGSHSSAVDVMAVEDPQPLIPEKKDPPIPESDLETEETETDEEFYDEHPQRLANKLYAEKRNQLMLLASVAPSDNGSMAGDISRPETPEKQRSPKKKSKTKKRKKSKRETPHKHAPIKLNIPKELIGQSIPTSSPGPALIPNKITISLHSNTVQIPSMPKSILDTSTSKQSLPSTSQENKRASKRRRVPNKFYGYSSDDETVTKLQQPPKVEWRKEDLPSPVVTHKPHPTVSHRIHSYNDSIIRMSTPVPDPVPPPILMNTESMESSGTDSSDEFALKIVQPNAPQNSIPVPLAYGASPGVNSVVNFPKPAGVRQAREGESVYCYCQCPYDEVSEMIACDAIGCAIEWFHFECVGIMVPPKGKWYCPDCRQRQGYT